MIRFIRIDTRLSYEHGSYNSRVVHRGFRQHQRVPYLADQLRSPRHCNAVIRALCS